MRITSIFFMFLISLFLFGKNTYSQAKVTGHIVAEVVEIAGVKSATNSSFFIKADQVVDNMNLGMISVDGGACTAGAVVLTSTNLEGNHGGRISFSATVENRNGSIQTQDETGTNIYSVSGKIDEELFRLTDNEYTGIYTIVFAYN